MIGERRGNDDGHPRSSAASRLDRRRAGRPRPRLRAGALRAAAAGSLRVSAIDHDRRRVAWIRQVRLDRLQVAAEVGRTRVPRRRRLLQCARETAALSAGGSAPSSSGLAGRR